MSCSRVRSDSCTTRIGQLRRNEDHPAVAAQHHIARHHRGMADAGGAVDGDHGGVQRPAFIADAAEMVRRIIGAHKGDEVGQLLQAIDVAHRAVIDDAVAGAGIDGVADIVADGRAIHLQPEMIADIDVALLQHVHRPGIGAALAPVDLAVGLDHFLQVQPPGNPGRGQGAAHQDLVGVKGGPAVFILMLIAGIAQRGPGFFQGDAFHAVQDGVRHLGPAIGETLAFPFRRVMDDFGGARKPSCAQAAGVASAKAMAPRARDFS